MDSRTDLHEAVRPDALIHDISRLQAEAAAWPDAMRLTAGARMDAIEALNGEAFRRLLAALKGDPACAHRLREAAADPFVYAVLRRHGLLKPSLQERVMAALDSVRPMLAQHGGDVELVAVDPPAIELRLTGACDGCPASALTFYAGVKQAVLDQVPEITQIRQVKGTAASRVDAVTSPFAGEGWIDTIAVGALEEGRAHCVEAAGMKLILARTGEAVACFVNACAHLGLAFEDGDGTDGILTCPHHGFRYELESGGCLTAPQVQLQTAPVRIDAGRVLVRPHG